MAFTADEKISIANIVGIDLINLDERLDYYTPTWITPEVETAVQAEIARWSTAGGEFTSIEPKESNKGVRVDSGLEKNDIRRNIANLLFLTDYLGAAAGSSQGVLVRG